MPPHYRRIALFVPELEALNLPGLPVAAIGGTSHLRLVTREVIPAGAAEERARFRFPGYNHAFCPNESFRAPDLPAGGVNDSCFHQEVFSQ